MEERDTPEPEHDYLLDRDGFEDELEADEFEVPDTLCERNDAHVKATYDIGGHYLCDDCAEE